MPKIRPTQTISKPSKPSIESTIINLLRETGHKYNYCIYYKNDNSMIKNFKLFKQLGRNLISGNAKVFAIEYNGLKIAVKIFIYEEHDASYQQALKELQILRIIESLSENIIHFPNIYLMDECPIKFEESQIASINAQFPYIADIINHKYLLVFTELKDGTLHDFILSQLEHLSLNISYNLIIQIIFAIYFFHKYTNHIHNDLHNGNILFKVYDNYLNIKYSLNGKNYVYVDNNNVLLTISDFDSCSIITSFDEIKSDYYRALGTFNIGSIQTKSLLSDSTTSARFKNKLNIIYDFYIIIVRFLRTSTNEDDFINKFINYCIENSYISELR